MPTIRKSNKKYPVSTPHATRASLIGLRLE
jgi:hypothetical protein